MSESPGSGPEAEISSSPPSKEMVDTTTDVPVESVTPGAEEGKPDEPKLEEIHDKEEEKIGILDKADDTEEADESPLPTDGLDEDRESGEPPTDEEPITTIELRISQEDLPKELKKTALIILRETARKIRLKTVGKTEAEIDTMLTDAERIIINLRALAFDPPRAYSTKSMPYGIPIGIRKPGTSDRDNIKIKEIRETRPDGTAECYTSTGDGTGRNNKTEIISRERIAEQLLLEEGEDLMKGAEELFTDEEKIVIGKYLKTINGEALTEGLSITDQEELQKTLEGAAQTSGALTSLDITPMVEDPVLREELSHILIIDDPNILKRIVDATPEKQTHLADQLDAEAASLILQASTLEIGQEVSIPGAEKPVKIQNIKQLQEVQLESQERSNFLYDRRDHHKNLANVLKENPESFDGVFTEIVTGERPEFVRALSEISKSGATPDQIISTLIERIAEEFPNSDEAKKLQGWQEKLKKYGPKVGKIGLIAAIGLMYALMKSGKEQPQGYQ